MLDIASKWVIFINGSFLKNGSETVQSMNMTLVSPLEWADGWRNILMHIYIIGKRKRLQSLFRLIY
ncbi:hypothetical protein M972_112375 [Acetivibrio thermocellus AD2]|jgi:hypothetical protein|nr:hypothetical protein [Acetivibrio thermocellus]ALX09289.1 hypothetical protein AD2_02301 [Acetivibrio thermocellus AD2]ANV77041.1 hypothetical protein LQRI_2300 [Acetivibrio thermocellus DSM 2360]EIC04757.1 hypothetical protein YSBL_1590 [Acetivibrio thermocellus YS]PFH03564.1 hypothetical protein M972_112375 [Acetivibrio thermocellus AD2]SOD23635.1 hypothetical protein SAMN04515622_1236 [Acetivibrio thermocellus]